jgi:hypothetical protein
MNRFQDDDNKIGHSSEDLATLGRTSAGVNAGWNTATSRTSGGSQRQLLSTRIDERGSIVDRDLVRRRCVRQVNICQR